MRNGWFLPVLVLLVAAPLVSCDDDDPVAPKPQYKSLSGPRDNVLFNLQKAWNERNIDRYDELLDMSFLFFFSQADIDRGYVDRVYWGRARDLSATKNVFDPNFSKPHIDPVDDIDLVLAYVTGDDEWTPITPEDQEYYRGETWYEKVVSYRLSVTAGDMQYVGNDIQTSIVVREANELGYADPIWQIVVWEDDIVAGSALPLAKGPRNGLSEDCPWGRLKFIYFE